VTVHSGSAKLKGTTIAAASSEPASTRCRSAAERFDTQALSSRPAASMTEDRIARPISSVTPFAPGASRQFFDPRVLHEVFDPRELLVRDAGRFAAEQRGDRLGCRTLEEGVDEVLQRRAPRRVPGHRRHVDVAQPLFFVSDMPLALEHAELRADGGVAGARHRDASITSAAVARPSRYSTSMICRSRFVNRVGLRLADMLFL
jgi:hypothetical protein